MRNILTTLGNIPVTSSIIASLYPEVKTKSAKIAQLEKAGEIIRLRRNLFVVNPQETNLPGINLRYRKEALEFLEENLRFDMDRFSQLNPEIFSEYAKKGKKSTSILTILKLLQHE